MSAKHAKKNEFDWKVLLFVCAIVIFVIIAMKYITKISADETKKNTVAVQENVVQNVSEENITNTENTVIENSIENENTQKDENKVEEENVEKNEKDKTIPETKMQPGITDKKQKAIELVKQQWGSDENVDFVFDYVNENGEYVVAVKDRQTATVKYYFRVNLETESVELD